MSLPDKKDNKNKRFKAESLARVYYFILSWTDPNEKISVDPEDLDGEPRSATEKSSQEERSAS